MKKKIFKITSLFLVFVFALQIYAISADAATRVYWYKKMTSGGSIF